MQSILNQLKQIFNWQNRFKEYAALNYLPQLQIQKLSLQSLQNLDKHLKKLVQKEEHKIKTSWVSTQYQILKLFANALSVIQSKLIENFNEEDWLKLQQIFYYKQLQTIKYELIRIVMDKKQHRRRWTAQQENFLIEIVKKSSKKNKWNQVARELFITSNGQFYRQGKHCRQRWLNHLHPSIQNQQWTDQQDLRLLKLILKKGKKWAKIAKKFSMKRSQCMVKKRFFELINKNQSLFISNETFKQLIKKAIQDKIKIVQAASSIDQRHSNKSASFKFQQDECNYMVTKRNNNFRALELNNPNEIKQKTIKNPFEDNDMVFHSIVQPNKMSIKQKQLCKQSKILKQQNVTSKLLQANNIQIIPIKSSQINYPLGQYSFPWNQRQLNIQNSGFKPYQPYTYYQSFPWTHGLIEPSIFFPYEQLNSMNMFFMPANLQNLKKQFNNN